MDMDIKTGFKSEVMEMRTGGPEDGVPYLVFPSLEAGNIASNAFSTRLGGVSTGIWTSMNLNANVGDLPENVSRNYEIMAEALGLSTGDMVRTDQTHTCNVRRVYGKDRGRGVIRERDYSDVDGLVTDEPGLVLVTSYADCVPLYFLDPARRAIGLSHSGWRGTVGRMGAETVRVMEREFGSRPEDLIAAVGPCICRDCYEVSDEVAEQFRESFGDDADEMLTAGISGEPGKYQLDLRAANLRVLLDAGLTRDHITISDLCTCCRSDLLWSHRATGGKRGGLAAFLVLNK